MLRFTSETPLLLYHVVCYLILCGDIIEEYQHEEHVECNLGIERNETRVKSKMLTENATVTLYMFSEFPVNALVPRDWCVGIEPSTTMATELTC